MSPSHRVTTTAFPRVLHQVPRVQRLPAQPRQEVYRPALRHGGDDWTRPHVISAQLRIGVEFVVRCGNTISLYTKSTCLLSSCWPCSTARTPGRGTSLRLLYTASTASSSDSGPTLGNTAPCPPAILPSCPPSLLPYVLLHSHFCLPPALCTLYFISGNK